MLSQTRLGIFCALAHAFLIASLALLVNTYSNQIHTTALIFFQNLVILLIVVFSSPNVIKTAFKTTRYPLHFLRAVFGFGIYAFHYQALRIISPITAVSLLHAAPVFIPFINWFLFKQRPNSFTLFGIIVGFCGVAFILGLNAQDFSQVVGVAVGLLAAICFAITFPITKILRTSESILLIIFLYSLHSLIFSTVWILAFGTWQFSSSSLILYLGVGILSFFQIFLINFAISNIGPTKAGMLTNFSVVFAIILNSLLGRSTLEALKFIGVFLVIASSLWILRTEHPKSRET